MFVADSTWCTGRALGAGGISHAAVQHKRRIINTRSVPTPMDRQNWRPREIRDCWVTTLHLTRQAFRLRIHV